MVKKIEITEDISDERIKKLLQKSRNKNLITSEEIKEVRKKIITIDE